LLQFLDSLNGTLPDNLGPPPDLIGTPTITKASVH
jgi:hypothetical protein